MHPQFTPLSSSPVTSVHISIHQPPCCGYQGNVVKQQNRGECTGVVHKVNAQGGVIDVITPLSAQLVESTEIKAFYNGCATCGYVLGVHHCAPL